MEIQKDVEYLSDAANFFFPILKPQGYQIPLSFRLV